MIKIPYAEFLFSFCGKRAFEGEGTARLPRRAVSDASDRLPAVASIDVPEIAFQLEFIAIRLGNADTVALRKDSIINIVL